MEHMSVSVTDGTIDKLRELAGGQRKIGAYLSTVVDWLWLNREDVQGHDLHEFRPMTLMADEEQTKLIEDIYGKIALAKVQQDAIITALKAHNITIAELMPPK